MTYQPRYTNLIQLFTQSIEQFGRKRLFGTRRPEGWHWTSYAEFAELVAAARGGLAARGIQRGDRVAVISNNRLEWAVCAFGTYSLGAIYVPMYEAQLDKDWQHILNDCGAKLCLVASPKIAARVERLRPSLPELQHLIGFDDGGYAALLAEGRKQPVAPSLPHDHDCAMFIYTSGTTGNPKGVRLTHYNLASNACGVIEVAPLKADEMSLAFLPWAHVFGGCVELHALMMHGDAIAICDDTDKLIDYLGEVKPTLLFAVPRIWNRIYDGVNKQIAARPRVIQQLFAAGMRIKAKQSAAKPLSPPERAVLLLADRLLFAKIRQRFGGRLRFAISGAAALAPEVGQFIDNLGIVVLEGYGLTETSGAATASEIHARRTGSVGRALPGCQLKLDESLGVSPGEGEVLIYGAGVMAGYHNAPHETSNALTADGGLRTGDLGRIDADGFLYITGRVKELYKLSNGKYIAPAPLEEKLQLSRFIAQAFVYGADRPYNTAVIVADLPSLQAWAEKAGVEKAPAKLLADPWTRDLLRSEIDGLSHEFKGYEQIRDFIIVGESFATDNDLLTPTFKIKRRNVVAKYKAELDALYAAKERRGAA